MKLAIIGSRSVNCYPTVSREVKSMRFNVSEVISGGAVGTDSLAEKIAAELNVKLTIIKPEWRRFGKSAGIIRNKKIVEESDFCIAFWDGKSKGTHSGIEFCKKMNKGYKVVQVPLSLV